MPEIDEIRSAILKKYPDVRVLENTSGDYFNEKVFAIAVGSGANLVRYPFFRLDPEHGPVGFDSGQPYPEGIIEAVLDALEQGKCGPLSDEYIEKFRA